MDHLDDVWDNELAEPEYEYALQCLPDQPEQELNFEDQFNCSTSVLTLIGRSAGFIF